MAGIVLFGFVLQGGTAACPPGAVATPLEPFDNGCVFQEGCFSLAGDYYENGLNCSVSLCADSTYTLKGFSIEVHIPNCGADALVMDGVRYCGHINTSSAYDDDWIDITGASSSNLPSETGTLATGAIVTFESDETDRARGVLLCFEAEETTTTPPAPPPPPSPSSDDDDDGLSNEAAVAIAIGSAVALSAIFLALHHHYKHGPVQNKASTSPSSSSSSIGSLLF